MWLYYSYNNKYETPMSKYNQIPVREKTKQGFKAACSIKGYKMIDVAEEVIKRATEEIVNDEYVQTHNMNNISEK
tara:strand:- start:8008 stop:8232 length:225 start_codon:yes stop_codon:yes gene_type:complete